MIIVNDTEKYSLRGAVATKHPLPTLPPRGGGRGWVGNNFRVKTGMQLFNLMILGAYLSGLNLITTF
jgi:hypothetical protein